MPKPKKGPRLASSPAHERLMLANMATSLFRHGQITELFTSIAKTMEQREGGYTRIVHLPSRQGDNAPMAVISLVTEPVSPKKAVVREAESAAKAAAKADDKAESAE